MKSIIGALIIFKKFLDFFIEVSFFQKFNYFMIFKWRLSEGLFNQKGVVMRFENETLVLLYEAYFWSNIQNFGLKKAKGVCFIIQ